MRPMAGHEQAQSKIRRKLTAFFRKNKHAIVAAALRHHDLAKADDGSPDYVDDSADWSVVVPLMQEGAEAVFKRAADAALDDLDVVDNGLVDRVSAKAVQYSRARAAELVGKRWTSDGQLVDTPDARWAITDSTRDFLNDDITAGLKEGLSVDALKAQLLDSYTFSPDRAYTIARTELAFAHTQGNLTAWKDSGVVTGKESVLSDSHDEEDECDRAADAGEIPIGADFPDGDDGPPYHPNCECALVAVLAPEEGLTEAGDE